MNTALRLLGIGYVVFGATSVSTAGVLYISAPVLAMHPVIQLAMLCVVMAGNWALGRWLGNRLAPFFLK